MLINACTLGGDYERTLRVRRILCASLLLVGLIGIACYILLVRSSSLPDFAQGFYLGAASGLAGAGLALLLRAQYLLTHPEARKKARIRETDEREQSINQSALLFAGAVTFFACAVALFVLLPINMGAFFALFGAIAVYALTWIAASIWLSKRR